MNDVLSKYWWVLTLRGALGIVFGLLALLMPGATFISLVYLFGAYLVADGVCTLVFRTRDYGQGRLWWTVVLEGLLTVTMGALAWIWPLSAALALLLWIAAWAVVTGGFEIAAAIRLRHVIEHEWLLLVAGFCSVAFGIFVAVEPIPGAAAVVWMLGTYALVFGGLFIALGLKARRRALTHSA